MSQETKLLFQQIQEYLKIAPPTQAAALEAAVQDYQASQAVETVAMPVMPEIVYTPQAPLVETTFPAMPETVAPAKNRVWLPESGCYYDL